LRLCAGQQAPQPVLSENRNPGLFCPADTPPVSAQAGLRIVVILIHVNGEKERQDAPRSH
jgi:hypothetical protein